MKSRFAIALVAGLALFGMSSVNADTLTVYFGNTSRVDYAGKFGDIAPSASEPNQVEFYHSELGIPWTICGINYLISQNCMIPAELIGYNTYSVVVKGIDDTVIGNYSDSCHGGIPAYINGELSLSINCNGRFLPWPSKKVK